LSVWWKEVGWERSTGPETSLADNDAEVGRLGNSSFSSSTLKPVSVNGGSGAIEKKTTVAADVSNPLTISNVASHAVQACRLRGGTLPIAARKTVATRHNNGN
jgi:hypothetical protein